MWALSACLCVCLSVCSDRCTKTMEHLAVWSIPKVTFECVAIWASWFPPGTAGQWRSWNSNFCSVCDNTGTATVHCKTTACQWYLASCSFWSRVVVSKINQDYGKLITAIAMKFQNRLAVVKGSLKLWSTLCHNPHCWARKCCKGLITPVFVC